MQHYFVRYDGFFLTESMFYSMLKLIKLHEVHHMRNREFKVLQIQAYEYIKERILNGTFTFNRVYSETGLAQEIGISRTPVRDAIHLLYQEGLVDIIPSKGFSLHKLTEQDVMETYEIRSAIEGYCARKLALDHTSKSARKLLLELHASMEKLQAIFKAAPDVELFADEDQNFHYLLVSHSGNEAFVEIFSQYMYRIKKLACYSLAKAGRMEQTLEEHREILDTISRGDGQGAYNATLHHMRTPLDFNLESIYE